jgi:hypothetical protein
VTTFQDLAQQNPDVQEQYETWLAERDERGQDPSDYAAFRRHLIDLGAPDPGPEEPTDFNDGDLKAAHPERGEIAGGMG